MDTLSPLSAPPSLPPMPAQGNRASGVNSLPFKDMLAAQGIQSPISGSLPSEAEAKISAAQIASKANVHAALKREPVLAGMATTPPPVVPATGRFMPLRQGPGAARNFLATTPQAAAANSVQGLRATTKFAPGPLANPNLAKAVPAVARSLKSPSPAPVAPARDSAMHVSAPQAAEVYAFGLRATTAAISGDPDAGQTQGGQIPPWFDSALQSGLEKYQAMKKTSP